MPTKTVASLLVFLSILSHCFAQVKWDVQAGLNFATVLAKDRDGSKVNTSSVPGIYLSLGIGIPLSKRFSIEPSLVYAKRGAKARETSMFGWGKDFDARVSYVELPVSLQYSPEIGPGRLLIAAGPYLAYGTAGKWTTSAPVLIGDIMIDNKGDVKFQSDASYGAYGTYVYGRPWDYGARVSLGYALFERYTLSFALQEGIANLQPRWADYQPEGSLRNRSIGLILGYRF